MEPGQSNLKRDQTDTLVALLNSGNAEALECEARAYIEAYPDKSIGPQALAVSLMLQGDAQGALAVIDGALGEFPEDAELLNNKAAVLIQLSRFGDAQKCAETALFLDSSNSSAHANRGLALKHQGLWIPALQAYQAAIELNPGDHQALNNAGVALLTLNMPEQAVQCFKAAIEVKSDFEDARFNLNRAEQAVTFQLLKKARAELEQSLDSYPDRHDLRARLFDITRSVCDFEVAAAHARTLLQTLRSGRLENGINVFQFLAMEDATPEDQYEAGNQYAEVSLGQFIQRPPLVSRTRSAHGNGKLRIGYLSSDFHNHATSTLLAGVFEASQEFETVAYSCGRDDGSQLRRRVEQAFTVFRDLESRSSEDVVRQIVEDGIDILVDLKGYTKGNRLDICALRPAPVIASWLGYPGTLGHGRLADYLIGDAIVTPLKYRQHFSETLALMPHSYQPNDDRRAISARPSREEFGLPAKAFVFCSFNHPHKLTASMFAQWCKLLKAVPNSVLWMLAEGEETRINLISRAMHCGVDRARLIFADPVPSAGHLGRLQLADLALDTFPCGSHTTGSDALWAGVPLLAIRGQTFASRVSASLLNAIGLPELITESPEQATDLAIELATNRDRLAKIRAQLAANRNTAPLFDTRRFAQDLERLFAAMWAQHLEGRRAPIVLDP